MSVWLTTALSVAGVLVLLWIFVMQLRTKKPLRSILTTGLQGFCALAAVDVVGAFTGVSLAPNLLTGIVSLVLGLPGIVGVLLLNLIFI